MRYENLLDGYEKISTQESKKCMLDILINVTNFCDENGLTYFIGYGTLIGAIRHQGFIPWDDDIDIIMPRPDYERLITLFKQNPMYELYSTYGNMPMYSYAKVIDKTTRKLEEGIDYTRYPPLGVDIDIFPFDGYPKNSVIFKVEGFTFRILHLLKYFYMRPFENEGIKNRMKNVLSFLLVHLFKPSTFLKAINKLQTKYDFDKADYVGYRGGYTDLPLKKEWFMGKTAVMFENHRFWAPKGYDEFLTTMYGDYMTPPPKDQCESTHKNYTYRIVK